MSSWSKGRATVDTDRSRLDLTMMHAFLTESYWARGRTLEQVRRAVDASLPFGLYLGPAQAGFARVVTDRLTFAYLADVFVVPAERGQGLGSFLLACVLAHPELVEVRTWTLFTRDAHDLYRRFGFEAPTEERSRRLMVREGASR